MTMCQRLPTGIPAAQRRGPVNTSTDAKNEPACTAAWTQVAPRPGFQICQGGHGGDNMGDICIGVPVTKEQSPYDRAPRCAFCDELIWW